MSTADFFHVLFILLKYISVQKLVVHMPVLTYFIAYMKRKNG